MKVLLIVDDEAYARQAVVNTIPWAEYGVEVQKPGIQWKRGTGIYAKIYD